MNTRKLTEAAMLSAAFVVLSVFLIGMGMGYFGYIDFIVPVLMVIIYLKCGFKYAVLSSFTCIILVIFAIGNLPSAILISQSMIYGIICAFLILSSFNIMDDIFYGSLLACIAMLIIDFNFSKIIGYSIITQCRESMEYAIEITSSYYNSVTLSQGYINTIFYLLIISLPVGTMLITYILGIILGKRFKILKEKSLKKFKIIKNFKRYGSLISCSQKTVIVSLFIIIMGNIFKMMPIIINITQLDILINSIMYVSYFFLIQDSVNIISKGTYIMFRSRVLSLCIQFMILVAIINYFDLTFVLIVACNFILDYIYKIKYKANLFVTQYM